MEEKKPRRNPDSVMIRWLLITGLREESSEEAQINLDNVKIKNIVVAENSATFDVSFDADIQEDSDTDNIVDEIKGKKVSEARAYLENLESRGEDIGKEPRITLSTIHQQKGGEAENVIVSLDIGKMAYDDYKKNPVNEHRLFYVAFSRAKENLYIMTPTSREAYRV